MQDHERIQRCLLCVLLPPLTIAKLTSIDTDKDLKERYSEGSETTSSSAFEGVSTEGIAPPIWFKPSEVWEIRGADFTLSPVYLGQSSLPS